MPVPTGWVGSEPEWLVYEWLSSREIIFRMEVPEMGGRLDRGGAIIDFSIEDRQPPLYIRVQSQWWHTQPDARTRDELQKINLLNQGYEVVDVWERRVRENVNRVMSAALRGEELGP